MVNVKKNTLVKIKFEKSSLLNHYLTFTNLTDFQPPPLFTLAFRHHRPLRPAHQRFQHQTGVERVFYGSGGG